MTYLYTILFQVFNGFITVYTAYVFFDVFAKPVKMKLKWAFLLGVSAAFILTLIFTKVGAPRLIILFALIFLTSMTFKMHWYVHILLSVAMILLSSLVEQMVAISMSMILGLDTEALKIGFNYIIGGVLAKILDFGVVAIVRTGKHAHISGIAAPVVFIGALPVSSFMMVLILADYINKINDNSFMRGFTVATLLMVCLTNVVAYYVVDRVYANMQAQQDLKIANQLIDLQRQQYQNLYDNQREIRKHKHDVKNVLLGVLAGVKAGDTDAVIKQLEEATANLSESEKVISGNQTVDTILAVKTYEAKQAGVTLIADVENITSLPVDPVDFSVMMGNALDNAIEATKELENGDKTIKVRIVSKGANLVVAVTNPVPRKIDVDNMKTSKKDKKNHGFGVLQIKSLAEQNNGEAFFECTDEEFKCTLFLGNKAV